MTDLAKFLEALSKLKGPIQGGVAIFVVACLAVVNINSIQVFPSTLIVLLIPIAFIVLNMPRALKDWQKFCILIICLVFCFGLLGLVALNMATGSHAPSDMNALAEKYSTTYEPLQIRVDSAIVQPNANKIRAMGRNEYGRFITDAVSQSGLGPDVVRIADFYIDVIRCERQGKCPTEAVREKFDEPILRFYSYFPYLETLRSTGRTPTYAHEIEERAKLAQRDLGY